MFIGLDDVSWERLSAAYGSAAHFPQFLPDLTSPDPAIFDRGIEKIYLHSIHQFTLYSVTPVVIPFLLQAAARQPDPQFVAALLRCAETLASYGADWLNPPWERTITRDPAEDYSIDEQCYAAGLEHIDTVLGYLDHATAAVRLAAYEFLALFPEASDHYLSAMIEGVRAESDPAILAKAIEFLAQMCLRRQRQGRHLHQPYQDLFLPWRGHPAAQIRWRAIQAIIMLNDGAPSDPDLVDALLAPLPAFNADADDEAAYYQIWDAWRSSSFLSEEQGAAVLSAYLRRLTDPYWVYYIAEQLINRVIVQTHYDTLRTNTLYDDDKEWSFTTTAFIHSRYKDAFAAAVAQPTELQRSVVREVHAALAKHRIQTNLLAFCGLDQLLD